MLVLQSAMVNKANTLVNATNQFIQALVTTLPTKYKAISVAYFDFGAAIQEVTSACR